MVISIKILTHRGREEPREFAKKYWRFREHISRLLLKGHLPMDGVEFEFGGTQHYLMGQQVLPFPEPDEDVLPYD